MKLPAALAALFLALPAAAHEHGEQWTLANEYPASSLPGEGDEFFAKEVADLTQGHVSIVTMPDAKMGYKSREQLSAVAQGKVAMADTFGGALGGDEPIFALSSLPFAASGIAGARALYNAAHPFYEKAFERHHQKLLYATPWPPSGLWSKEPMVELAAYSGLRVRTYDSTGAFLFSRLGAKPMMVSYADLGPKLASGEVNAVLSSGDGGAARSFWDYLPRFTQLDYAIPLSFTTVNYDRWISLDDKERAAVLLAAQRTEARVWKALEARVAENYARMREHGVTIDTQVSPALAARLRAEAAMALRQWAQSVGPEAREILEQR
ncbi:MAG TPA: TRAP transporter substrate-binding protein [Usitatibacter sp.]|nr:TRAP transporter substrate-binding protein [Usitatibacter sp.]